MKKDTKIYLIIGVIVILIIIGIFWMKKNGETVDEKTAKCIAEKSEFYVQLGCKFCNEQENLFKDNYIYLNVIDCHYQPEKCADVQITHTPTWFINGKKYEGLQSIQKLKELTGC